MNNFPSDSEQGAFNFGIEYLKTICSIERIIDIAIANQDFGVINKYLDILWMELYEWLDDEEIKAHNKLRDEQHKSHNLILKAIKNGEDKVKKEITEKYYERYRELKKLIHKKGLRMPKKDDPSFAMR